MSGSGSCKISPTVRARVTRGKIIWALARSIPDPIAGADMRKLQFIQRTAVKHLKGT